MLSRRTFFKQITKNPSFLSALNAKPFFLTQNNEAMYIFTVNQFVTAVILKCFLEI